MSLNASRVGEMTIQKGSVDGVQINLWDKVRKCRGAKCKLADSCGYNLSENPLPDSATLCQVERKYVKTILNPFLQLLKKVNDPFISQWVGFHLIPLYLDLVHIKMEKVAITNSDEKLTYTDNSGQKRIHPIFEESRRLHKEIFSIWKSTGLLKIATENGFFKTGGKIVPEDGDISTNLTGDGNEYEEMAGA